MLERPGDEVVTEIDAVARSIASWVGATRPIRIRIRGKSGHWGNMQLKSVIQNAFDVEENPFDKSKVRLSGMWVRILATLTVWEDGARTGVAALVGTGAVGLARALTVEVLKRQSGHPIILSDDRALRKRNLVRLKQKHRNSQESTARPSHFWNE